MDIETIMCLVRLCGSSSSYFRYDHQFFTRIMGLPMDTSLSPFLATFYMEFIETSALENFPLRIRFWGPFVDDVISVWDHGEESLNSFLTTLNTLDSNLQFTLELEDNHKLPFLDVLIFNKSPKFGFSIYRQHTHNDRYLHLSSIHSPSIKRGVVISLVDRVVRICSEPHIVPELNYIKDILFCIGYPKITWNRYREKTKKKGRKVINFTKSQQISSHWWMRRNFSLFYSTFQNWVTNWKESLKNINLISPLNIQKYRSFSTVAKILCDFVFFMVFGLFWTKCLSQNFDEMHLRNRGAFVIYDS